MDYVSCTGYESKITDCGYNTALTSSCSHGALVGVVCQSKMKEEMSLCLCFIKVEVLVQTVIFV